jgi:hypothetical protein
MLSRLQRVIRKRSGAMRWLSGMIRERRYAIRCNREGVNFHRTVIRETLARIRSLRVSIRCVHD